MRALYERENLKFEPLQIVILRLSQNALEKFVADLQQTLSARDAS